MESDTFSFSFFFIVTIICFRQTRPKGLSSEMTLEQQTNLSFFFFFLSFPTQLQTFVSDTVVSYTTRDG